MNIIKLGSWNIHGLGKKLKDEDVVSFVNSLDFVAFVETWTSVRSTTNFRGYGSVHQIRKKRKTRGRPHGGILFLYKTKYKNFIDKQVTDHEDLMIIRIKTIGHNRGVYVFIVYV